MNKSFFVLYFILFSNISQAFISVCERSRVMRVKLEGYFKRDCSLISGTDLATGIKYDIWVNYFNQFEIRAVDFQGFSNVSNFTILGVPKQYLSKDIFKYLKNKKNLDLEFRNDELDWLPEGLFDGFNIDSLDLSVKKMDSNGPILNKAFVNELEIDTSEIKRQDIFSGLTAKKVEIGLMNKDHTKVDQKKLKIFKNLSVENLSIDHVPYSKNNIHLTVEMKDIDKSKILNLVIESDYLDLVGSFPNSKLKKLRMNAGEEIEIDKLPHNLQTLSIGGRKLKLKASLLANLKNLKRLNLSFHELDESIDFRPFLGMKDSIEVTNISISPEHQKTFDVEEAFDRARTFLTGLDTSKLIFSLDVGTRTRVQYSKSFFDHIKKVDSLELRMDYYLKEILAKNIEEGLQELKLGWFYKTLGLSGSFNRLKKLKTLRIEDMDQLKPKGLSGPLPDNYFNNSSLEELILNFDERFEKDPLKNSGWFRPLDLPEFNSILENNNFPQLKSLTFPYYMKLDKDNPDAILQHTNLLKLLKSQNLKNLSLLVPLRCGSSDCLADLNSTDYGWLNGFQRLVNGQLTLDITARDHSLGNLNDIPDDLGNISSLKVVVTEVDPKYNPLEKIKAWGKELQAKVSGKKMDSKCLKRRGKLYCVFEIKL